MPTSASGLAIVALSGRIQSWRLPATVATKASVRPSGEIVGQSKLVALSGGVTDNRSGSASSAGRRTYATPSASKANDTTPNPIHARRSRQPLLGLVAVVGNAATASVRLPPDILVVVSVLSAKPRSCAE